MLPKLTKSRKINRLKLMGDKIRIKIGIILNITNTMSDIGNIVCFFTTRTAFEPLLLYLLTCGSEANEIEMLEVLPSVNNSKNDV